MKYRHAEKRHQPRSTILFTCEHASNRVPVFLNYLFTGQSELLASHRGWDEGALLAAKILAKNLDAPIIIGRFSRLVIDLNRSPHHRKLFSEFSLTTSAKLKKALISQVYAPFRRSTLKKIHDSNDVGKIMHHFSVHSFTPVLDDEVRNCEIGILYDPKRPHERRLAQALKDELAKSLPKLRIRLNYPYRGTADGHTTYLRKRFLDSRYTGIELEINQAWIQSICRSAKIKHQTLRFFSDALKSAIESI